MKYEIIGSSSKGNCIIVEEKWKPIEDFRDKYEISNLGRIKNIRTNHILKMTNQYGDYFCIILYDETHKRSTRIHREVAKAFIPNPNNYKEINHKDGNKQNNRVENLEWCSRKHNIKHALETGLNSMKYLNCYNKNKFNNKYGKLYQYDKNKNLLNIYNNTNEAHDKTGVCIRNILQCINHEPKRKTAGGYVWLCEKEVMNNEI